VAQGLSDQRAVGQCVELLRIEEKIRLLDGAVRGLTHRGPFSKKWVSFGMPEIGVL
jgi:hypothetical protein